jgi:MFS family permease
MSNTAKEIVIYSISTLVIFPYSIITAFYPEIARAKGIPVWLIGIVFSLNPAVSIFVTLGLGKYMKSIGRKTVLLASLVLISISMFLLSPIEYLETNYVLILSFACRIIGGIGSACAFTSITTIFVSDYPEKIQIMLGRMEGAVGLGLILGPLIGTALYMINLFVALNVIGLAIFLFCPVAWLIIGELKEYKIKDINIDRFRLFFKPVFST